MTKPYTHGDNSANFQKIWINRQLIALPQNENRLKNILHLNRHFYHTPVKFSDPPTYKSLITRAFMNRVNSIAIPYVDEYAAEMSDLLMKDFSWTIEVF